MAVTIIGCGMVGGNLAKVLRERGEDVRCVDPGRGLDDSGAYHSPVYVVAVPTPPTSDGYDLRNVQQALSTIPGGAVAILRSTVLPGTTDTLQRQHPGISLVFAPEFLTEATAYQDTATPLRTVVGIPEGYSTDLADVVFATLPAAQHSLRMTARQAETLKCATNVWYAVKVAFANEVYDVAGEADYAAVRAAMALDPMVGANHWDVWHGGYRGFGGKCLPKEVSAWLSAYPKTETVQAAANVNARLRPDR